MKLNKEGVDKAVTAVFGYINPDDDSWFQYKSIVEGILTAYFDHLKQEGLMQDGRGWDHVTSGYWGANSSDSKMLPHDFLCLIIRQPEE